MALHRDIFWIGRQWAVTGFGMQAINQKHDGQFDIPAERLWDDDLPNGASEQKWFNPDDFNKGLEIARTRHPRPPSRPAPSPRPVKTLLQATVTTEPAASPAVPAVEAAPIAASEAAPEPVKPPKPVPLYFQMRIASHPAKFLRVWRARRRN